MRRLVALSEFDQAFDTNSSSLIHTTTMGAPFDFAPERPDHMQQILDGLDRYNPETTGVFQDYVMQQCENQTYDCYANLALLKLYVPRSSLVSITGVFFTVFFGCVMSS